MGSRHFVKHLSRAQKSSFRAFVNLECLGLTAAKVWVRRSNPELIARLVEVANTFRLPLQGVNVEKVGDDDTHPFLEQRIPVISIHSILQDTLPILHSVRDNPDMIRQEDYYETYKLVAFYLAYLDAKLTDATGPRP